MCLQSGHNPPNLLPNSEIGLRLTCLRCNRKCVFMSPCLEKFLSFDTPLVIRRFLDGVSSDWPPGGANAPGRALHWDDWGRDAGFSGAPRVWSVAERRKYAQVFSPPSVSGCGGWGVCSGWSPWRFVLGVELSSTCCCSTGGLPVHHLLLARAWI